MLPYAKELHACEVGDETWWFRTPTSFDLPRMRRQLTREGIRRPQLHEFKIASLAGLAALGAQLDEALEADRQRDVVEQWYELLAPLDEDDIDEPDQDKRAVELAERRVARVSAQQAIVAEFMAIEANLERHWPPFAELLADRRYWDDVSAIMVVRLLLRRRGDAVLDRDPEDRLLLSDAAYVALPDEAKAVLGPFASALLAPSETQRKN